MKYNKKIYKQHKLLVGIVVLSVTLLGAGRNVDMPVFAADTDITSAITVDSTGDGADASIGDGICDDGSGNCTFRAAIEESNNTPGVQTIEFNISGAPDFTNGGQNGYTIKPQFQLPGITDTVTIDGYSQSGAMANTAVAPNPLNGTLLIEIDGSSVGSNLAQLSFVAGSEGSTIRGLVINRSDGVGINPDADDIVIAGNYIGTDVTGMMASPNDGAGIGGPIVNGIRIGGTSAADRNLISGNTDSAGYPTCSWIIQGNYIGVDKTGEHAIPNNTVMTAGAFSVDDCDGTKIGGTEPGAINVISGNAHHGIAPSNTPGLIIQGNYIGTDYTGTKAVPNNVGITLDGDQAGSIIGGTTEAARNIISGNTLAGIISGSNGLSIKGNYVGLDVTGSKPLSNVVGILAGDNNLTIGGDSAGRNVVSGNTVFNISVQGLQFATTGSVISGNYVGTDAEGEIKSDVTNAQGEGIRVSGNISDVVVGGAGNGSGNLVAGNRGVGIAVRQLTITSFSVTAVPANISILGNVVYGNVTGGPIIGAQGLGIDVYEATVNNLAGLPADINADSYIELGPTVNDAGDADTGPNDYINFPILGDVTQSGSKLDIGFELDAIGSPSDQYRVEFFANDEADPSGHGEGQTYLGFTDVDNGTNKTASITLPAGTNLTGKVLSATTTAINSGTNSGFGSTSEFSLASDIDVLPVIPDNTKDNENTASGTLSNTGTNVFVLSTLAVFAIASSGFTIRSRKTGHYIRPHYSLDDNTPD